MIKIKTKGNNLLLLPIWHCVRLSYNPILAKESDVLRATWKDCLEGIHWFQSEHATLNVSDFHVISNYTFRIRKVFWFNHTDVAEINDPGISLDTV